MLSTICLFQESLEFSDYCTDVFKRLRDVILSFDEDSKQLFLMGVEKHSNSVRKDYFDVSFQNYDRNMDFLFITVKLYQHCI